MAKLVKSTIDFELFGGAALAALGRAPKIQKLK